jgi:predicted transcriptional regulator
MIIPEKLVINNKTYISSTQAISILGVSRERIYQYIKGENVQALQLKTEKINGVYWIEEENLKKFQMFRKKQDELQKEISLKRNLLKQEHNQKLVELRKELNIKLHSLKQECRQL